MEVGEKGGTYNPRPRVLKLRNQCPTKGTVGRGQDLLQVLRGYRSLGVGTIIRVILCFYVNIEISKVPKIFDTWFFTDVSGIYINNNTVQSNEIRTGKTKKQKSFIHGLVTNKYTVIITMNFYLFNQTILVLCKDFSKLNREFFFYPSYY